MLNYALAILSAALYSVAAFRLVLSLQQRSDPSPYDAANPRDQQDQQERGRQTTLGLVALAMLIHAWIALRKAGVPDTLNLPFFTALVMTALVIVVIQLALSLRRPADYLGLAVYPVAAITVLLSPLSAELSAEAAATQDLSIGIHVLLSLVAYSVLALAACQAILVAIQRRRLRDHRPGGLIRALPPLESTESLLFVLLSVGFGILTLSLGSGFLYLEDMFAQHLVHKTVLSCIGWAIFAVLLFGRWRFGWRGRRAVHWILAGFALLITAYFGSKLVLELILQRGL